MKVAIWFIFILAVIITGCQSYVLYDVGRHDYGIVQLELACKAQGKGIINYWHGVAYGNGTLLNVARSNTHWDFLFIVTYVTLMLLYSYLRMQREQNILLNELLRLNLLLALLTGLFDVAENLIMLHNMHHAADGLYYCITLWVTIPKSVLSVWILLVLLVSFLKSLLNGKIFVEYNKTT